MDGIDIASAFERLAERAPQLGWTLAILAAAIAAALLVHWLVYRITRRLVARQDLVWRSIVARTSGPTRLAAVIVAVAFASPLAAPSEAGSAMLRHALLVFFIVLVAWVARTALHIWTTVHLRRFKLDSHDNLLARKHVTQTRILRRVADTLIVVIAIGAVMMTFESVRQYGVSLLASAGAAGLVVGLALQPLLKNLFAGVQLALTQPIRLDDAVIVEGEWGKVEEITSTYVVVRIWDWRRMILPLSYFIEQPFQNWTRETASLIGAVKLYVDYTVPVEALRARVAEVLAETELWDGDVMAVQVTDLGETTMTVRVIASAADSGKAWDLRCLLRERLVAYLQENHPEALPRLRADVAGRLATGPEPVDDAPGPTP
ncbi:mechanosensitive ion channel family protein [Aquibium sp. A9E412]|uniref:mechanosensitive ion channel family protein n=1 Tax=Aquibium sp. A9E412 TaxID=2976767 RepID=UPI0025B24CBB|nr:mechanosensitive ion channel family protein [Aquibium sp. A9E412]MDN2566105.1 mechanosensitive ion channel family protein [Aquibium sp. A9E412]